MAILQSEIDRYGGRVVDDATLPRDTRLFAADLHESIDAWRSEDVQLVWLTLPLGRAELVPIAAKNGFVYHHATPDDVTLTLALTDNA